MLYDQVDIHVPWQMPPNYFTIRKKFKGFEKCKVDKITSC